MCPGVIKNNRNNIFSLYDNYCLCVKCTQVNCIKIKQLKFSEPFLTSWGRGLAPLLGKNFSKFYGKEKKNSQLTIKFEKICMILNKFQTGKTTIYKGPQIYKEKSPEFKHFTSTNGT